MGESWEVLSSRVALSNPWITVRQETVRLPSGLVLDEYNLVEQHDFVTIFGVTERDEVLFVRQYKHGIGRVTLEIPAGFIDPDEPPLDAANRELREETGYRGSLEQVAALTVSPTRSKTIEYVFFGRVELAGQQQLDPSEDIEVLLIPAADVMPRIRDGGISVLSTAAACLLCLPLIDRLP